MKQYGLFARSVILLLLVVGFAFGAHHAVAATIFTDTFESQNFSKWTSVDSGTLGFWKIDKTRYAGKFSATVVGPTGAQDDVLRKALPTNLYGVVTVSYWYKASGLDNKSNGEFDRVFVEYTLDGTTWIVLEEINALTQFSASGWNRGVHAVPSSAQFALRFRAQLSDSGDRVWFDNVLIDGVPTENTQVRCSDALDNDADGTIDKLDSDCAAFYPSLSVAVTGPGTVTSNPAGISCGMTCVADFLKGTVVQLSAVVSRGVAFLGWGGACTGTDGCSVAMQNDAAVTASFTPLAAYTLTLRNDGEQEGTIRAAAPAINCAGVCDTTVYEGEVVTLTAVPKTGYEFTGWSGACAGISTTCTLTLTGDAEVVAHYHARVAGECGNALVDWNEGCDDGNLTDGDGCSASCTIEGGFACTTGATGASQCFWNEICPPGTTFVSPNGWYGVCM